MLACSFVGSADTVARGLKGFVEEPGLTRSWSPLRSMTIRPGYGLTRSWPA